MSTKIHPQARTTPKIRQEIINSDLSHLSHTLRRAQYSGETAQLLNRLAECGWIHDAVGKGSVGELSGALMSLANYLPEELRKFILTPALEQRVGKAIESRLANGPAIPRGQFASWAPTLRLEGGWRRWVSIGVYFPRSIK